MVTETERLKKIRELIEEYAANPGDYNIFKVVAEIDSLYDLCPNCGAHLENWKEMLHEEHYCPNILG